MGGTARGSDRRVDQLLPGSAIRLIECLENRMVLDPILMKAALDAGAEVWTGAKVTALVRDLGRVTGVRVARNGSEQALEARLVVGAASTVGGRDGPFAGAWRMRPASAARRGGRSHRR